MGSVIKWVIRIWKTGTTSTWLLIAVITLVSGGAIKYYSMKATIAKCQQIQAQQERFNDLASQLKDRIENATDEEIEIIMESTHPCMSVTLDELLSGTDQGDQVPSAGTGNTE